MSPLELNNKINAILTDHFDLICEQSCYRSTLPYIRLGGIKYCRLSVTVKHGLGPMIFSYLTLTCDISEKDLNWVGLVILYSTQSLYSEIT